MHTRIRDSLSTTIEGKVAIGNKVSGGYKLGLLLKN